MHAILALLKDTWSGFQRHNAQWLAAALAYFAAFAVAPLIIVFVEIAGFVVHDDLRVLHAIYGYVDRDAGPGASAVRSIVTSIFSEQRNGLVAEIVGWSVFLFAAVGLFSALQFALNTVWDAHPPKMTIWATIRERAWSFVAMLLIALLLLLSVVVNAALAAASAYHGAGAGALAALVNAVDFLASFAVVWTGFALLFRYLPDTRTAWRDVALGSAITALLFVAGQFLVGWYLGIASLRSTFGAFGSLVAFLLWVNYSAQILLFGAEFTHAYAKRFGSRASKATR